MARNTMQPETPTMRRRKCPEEREDKARQRVMQMSEQPLQHEQRQHTSCNRAPAIAAWPTTALLPRRLWVRTLGPRMLHGSSMKRLSSATAARQKPGVRMSEHAALARVVLRVRVRRCGCMTSWAHGYG